MMYPQTQYGPKPIRTDQVAQRLRERLLHYFATVCPDRHGIRVPVDCADPDATDGTCVLRFDLPGPLATTARFSVEHVGGNVFEIVGGLENDPAERFSCCLPQPPSDDDLRALEDTIGDHLVTKIQCRVGSHVLRHPDQFLSVPSAVTQDPQDTAADRV